MSKGKGKAPGCCGLGSTVAAQSGKPYSVTMLWYASYFATIFGTSKILMHICETKISITYRIIIPRIIKMLYLAARCTMDCSTSKYVSLYFPCTVSAPCHDKYKRITFIPQDFKLAKSSSHKLLLASKRFKYGG